jgi:hypothetical protein
MVKAIASLGHDVDVLVGDRPDDIGAREVFQELRRWGTRPVVINEIYHGRVPLGIEPYDVAIMAIPYDGRWLNGLDFFAKRVLDGRKRPGNVERLGFDMWEKHEAEYMMENARELGFQGETPDGSFLNQPGHDPDLVYLGIGYKRDRGGFGLSKHFGNDRFIALIREVLRLRPGTRFVSSGPMVDLMDTARWITWGTDRQLEYVTAPSGALGLQRSFELIGRCGSYVGNDTGMMHVAASTGIPTMGLFAYLGLLVKNPPFCARSSSLFFDVDSSVEDIAERFVDFVWGKQCV